MIAKCGFWIKFLTVALLAFSTSVGMSSAQESAEAENSWVKVCNKDPNSDNTVCLTTQEIRADSGQFLASVAVREFSNQDKKAIILAVPTGLLVQPGLGFQVDQNEAKVVKYGICFANACYAEMSADDAVIAGLKRGNQLVLTAVNRQAKRVQFPLTLIGFTSAYDGEPMDPQELQARQQSLRENLQRKAEEARQRLIEQQQDASDN